MDIIINTELQSHFLRLYQIACCDNNFDVLEIKLLYKFAEIRGISTEHLDSILTNPARQLEAPDAVEKRIEYLYDLAMMIWVDETVTEDEYNLLKKYCEAFDFLPENISDLCNYLIECAKKSRPLAEVLNPIN